MSTSEILSKNIEANELQEVSSYEAIAARDTKRMPLQIALEEICDIENAAIFLKSYAKKIESMVDGSGNQIEIGDITSLELALADIKYMAGYHVSGPDFKKQLVDLLGPWNEACYLLSQQSK